MEIQFEYKNEPINDYRGLIKKYSISEFDSPYRSTIPFLHYWSDTGERLIDHLQWIGLNLCSQITLSFEYCVDVQRGKGKPSQTDLMIISDEYAIAIEAKYTEPPYENVKNWLGDSMNKLSVLEGWLDLINSVIGTRNIEVKDILELPYQMVHRCASVCFPNVIERILIYQCFDLDQEKLEYYKSQLHSLKHLLNIAVNFYFFFTNIPLLKSSDYLELQLRWDKGERKMCQDVIRCMEDSDFIKYGKSEIIKI